MATTSRLREKQRLHNSLTFCICEWLFLPLCYGKDRFWLCTIVSLLYTGYFAIHERTKNLWKCYLLKKEWISRHLLSFVAFSIWLNWTFLSILSLKAFFALFNPFFRHDSVRFNGFPMLMGEAQQQIFICINCLTNNFPLRLFPISKLLKQTAMKEREQEKEETNKLLWIKFAHT